MVCLLFSFFASSAVASGEPTIVRLRPSADAAEPGRDWTTDGFREADPGREDGRRPSGGQPPTIAGAPWARAKRSTSVSVCLSLSYSATPIQTPAAPSSSPAAEAKGGKAKAKAQ